MHCSYELHFTENSEIPTDALALAYAQPAHLQGASPCNRLGDIARYRSEMITAQLPAELARATAEAY